jgi:repressor LexA
MLNIPNRNLPPLTDRQRTLLIFLRDYVNEHGYPPTVRDMLAAVSVTSTSTVASEIRVLEARGYLHRTEGRARGLTLLTPIE